MKYYSIILFIMLLPALLCASKLDDLDNAPEGAHKDQMFLGAFITIGSTLGEIISAESAFLEDNIYYLSQGDIYKQLMISHLTFTAGVSYEWMPIDHLGLKFKTRYSHIIQRTIFGSDHQNWSAALYQDVSFYLGIAGHLTNRKMWDLSLTPLFGYAVAWMTPTAIVPQLEISDSNITNYSGTETIMVNNFTMGAELALTVFFKGGVYFSLGFEWIMNMIQFDSAPDVSQDGKVYFDGKTEAINHTLGCYISVGYAFDN